MLKKKVDRGEPDFIKIYQHEINPPIRDNRSVAARDVDAQEAAPCTCGSRTTSWMRKWKVRKQSSPAAGSAANRRRTAPSRRRAAGRVAGAWRRSSTALAAPYAASPEAVQSARKASTSLSSPAGAAIGPRPGLVVGGLGLELSGRYDGSGGRWWKDGGGEENGGEGACSGFIGGGGGGGDWLAVPTRRHRRGRRRGHRGKHVNSSLKLVTFF